MAKRELLGRQGRAVVVQERLPPPREQRTFEEYEASRMAKDASQVRVLGCRIGFRVIVPRAVERLRQGALGSSASGAHL